jgi:energy-coupling factor transporter ATP-binding protein EcfA2
MLLPPAPIRTPESAENPAQLVNTVGLTTRSWSFLLNEQPDQAPHVLLVGPSGAGKTTFTRALIAMRTGRVVVLTPKPDDDWGGAPVITIDDDGSFTTVAHAIEALGHEVRRRLVAGKRRIPVGEPLTIICDDFPVLVSEVGKPAAALFKLVGRLGRSLRVRLIVLSQSDRVKSLGLSGEGDAAENYIHVDLARGHRAMLHYEQHVLPLDTREVLQIAMRPVPPDRWWDVPVHVPATPSDMSTLERSRTSDDDLDLRPFQAILTGIPAVTSDGDTGRTGAVPPDGIDAETIKALHAAGWSMNRISSKMTRGNKQQRLERIHQALAGDQSAE